jgi:hypothetical protein
MSIHGRAVIPWDPAVGSADAPTPNQWLDASDTTTIDKAGPLPITNGAAIVEWRTKSGTLRKYQPFLVAGNGGLNTQPTWDANVVGSLGGVRCNGNNRNILGADVLTGMQSLTGRTVVCAFKFLTLIPTFGQGFVTTVPHQIGSADGVFHLMYCSSSISVRGRRLQADASVEADALTAAGGIRPVAAGEVFVETGIANYSAGTIRVLANGVQAGPAVALASSGTTAALDPYAMAVGGVLQEQPTPHFGNGYMDGYIFEILDWFSLLTPDQLVGPHDYLCNKWGAGAL